jgi:prepilin-type N-terminal cleavage/methylation domain-containing protein
MSIFRMDSRGGIRRTAAAGGFTLVELLVTIAIIGLLVSILLPAVQSARESTRRTACMQKLRQLGLATQAYHTTKGRYPVGSHNTLWNTWAIQLLPFIEQQSHWDAYDKRPYRNETRFNVGQNAEVTRRFFPAFVCPSDGESPLQTTMAGNPSAHNYTACTGNGVYVATTRGWLSQPPPGFPGVANPQPGFGNGMFRWGGGAFVMSGADENLYPPEAPRGLRAAVEVRERDVTDGLSKTFAFSEVIRRPKQASGLSADYRGIIWWGPGSLFSTITPPNSSRPDTLPDVQDCGPEPLSSYPPCIGPHSLSTPIHMAARSRHPGGVVVARLDTSVAFYADSIDPFTWEALGTTRGGEILGRAD